MGVRVCRCHQILNVLSIIFVCTFQSYNGPSNSDTFRPPPQHANPTVHDFERKTIWQPVSDSIIENTITRWIAYTAFSAHYTVHLARLGTMRGGESYKWMSFSCMCFFLWLLLCERPNTIHADRNAIKCVACWCRRWPKRITIIVIDFCVCEL